MKELFKDYISNLIEITFGFVPRVRIEMPTASVIKIFLDGSEDERKQMMGAHAITLQAIKRLLMCFSRRHNVYVFLYLEFPHALNTY